MPVCETNQVIAKLDEIASLIRELVVKQRPGRLMRLRQAAGYLDLSVWQLRRIIQDGSLPVVKPSDGNHAPWLVDKADLDQWVERNKTNF